MSTIPRGSSTLRSPPVDSGLKTRLSHLPAPEPTAPQDVNPTGLSVFMFCSHLYPQCSVLQMAHVNVQHIGHVTEFQWTMVLGGEGSELSLRAGRSSRLSSKSFLPVGQTHSSLPCPGLLIQTVSSCLSAAHSVPGTTLNALNF